MNAHTATDPTVHRLLDLDAFDHRRVVCGKDGEWLLTDEPVDCEECLEGLE